jgi:ribonucleoside-triphosphate reductase
MIRKIRKRDGKIEDFNPFRITSAIWKAAQAVGGKDYHRTTELTEKVLEQLENQLKTGEMPTVEQVQDTVEKVLIEQGHAKTAKAYILYRKQHNDIREIGGLLKDIDVVDGYLSMMDWKVNENSNMSYSLQGLNVYVTENIISHYWLNKIYPPEIGEAHTNANYHIHDLGTLGSYCVGWDLQDILLKGFQGVAGKIESKPAKHFGTALMQIVNYLYTLQGEAAGAQALSNFDTLLAPFIRHDGLAYKDIKQEMQKFLFNMNVPTRVGFQSPFSNCTLDLTIPSYMADEPVIIGGELKDGIYSDFADEMDMINHAFAEVMREGDAKERPFTFPIPTYNITKDFNWNNDGLDPIWEMTAKYGVPYFSNFINSDMKPEDSRSMCCRLRLSNRELRKRGGGLFGANPKTGSIGVVTINMPQIGYLSKDDDEFFERLDHLMDLAKQSLIIKREVIENLTLSGLHPYSRFYLSDIKDVFGEYWKNHFSTIGLIGMNDALLNFMNKSIADPEGKAFAEKVLDHMRDRMANYQEETGDIFNLEATPAEGSLAPDEKVLISQSDPRLDEIGPIIDNYLEKNDDKIQMVGTSEVLKLNHGEMFTYGFSRKSQKIKKYPVTALVRHPGKSMYKLTTVSGRKVKVTGQHSVFTLNDEGASEEILVGNLRAGVPIAIPKQIDIETTNSEFNLITLFETSSFRKRWYGLFPADFIEILISNPDVERWATQHYKLSWKDVKCSWRKGNVIPLSLIYDVGIHIERDVLESSKIVYGSAKNTKPMNVIIPINEEFGFILGCLLSEGCLEGRCEFSNVDRKFAQIFLHCVDNIFGKDVAHISLSGRKEPRNILNTVLLSKSIGLFFKEIGLHGKSNEKQLPTFLLSSHINCAAGLLRGFYLGESSYYETEHKFDHNVRLYANSKELAEGLNLLLLKFGIVSKIREDKKYRHNPKSNNTYVISISGAENLGVFFSNILKEKIQLDSTHFGRYITPGVTKLLKKVMHEHNIKPDDVGVHMDDINRNVRNDKISIQYLKQIVEKLSVHIHAKDETLERLKILVDSDIYWDEVKSIRKIKPPKYVYDLEVDIKDDMVNNFLGGSGLVCLHNTSYRLARIDKAQYPDIRIYNQEFYGKRRKVEPYYTNSTQLPVGFTDDVFEALDLQDSLQSKYTGGTVLHVFLGEHQPDATATKKLIRKIAENYSLPYYTMTPTFSICPKHGYIAGEHEYCPKCDEEIGYSKKIKVIARR